MAKVIAFRRRRVWRPSQSRRRRAAKARSPFITLYLMVIVSGLAWVGMYRLDDVHGNVTRLLGSGAVGECGGYTSGTCVVDGDTIEHQGWRFRLSDINTPEIGGAQCQHELRLALRARQRLIELMNAGPFEIVQRSDSDADVYGRKLRVVERDGRSLGDTLVAEGLAHRWRGYRQGWCG